MQSHKCASEVGTADVRVGERGNVLPDVRDILCVSCTGSTFVWVRYVGQVPAHWDYLGSIPPQGGPQTDGAETTDGNGWEVGVPPYGRGDGGSRPTGGRVLRIPPPDQSHTVHRYHIHYEYLTGGGYMPG